ncbi:MAG: hypothetical protein RBS78_04525 [Coriobacteriia bacterium]|jgi:hypothetical protein|nr:hypothetical protein [Coriobacteriia bacterium]
MFLVVGLVTLLSVVNDKPATPHYAPDALSSQEGPSAGPSVETTASDQTEPAVREEAAEGETSLDDSVRSRQERAASGSSGSTNQNTDAAQGDGGSQPKPAKSVPPITLSIQQRQDFYWRIVEAQDRAVADAEAKYPMGSEPPKVTEYVALWLQLTEKYEGLVRKQFGVTPEQADVIIGEGIADNWPMPPLPS